MTSAGHTVPRCFPICPAENGDVMRKRSAEREEFLNDILCTFAEGGIQMIGEIVYA